MVYEYTKPRGPIAAMYNSPGPAYGLPSLVGDKVHDPRSVHTKYPAFSFGVRHGKFKDDAGPGPAYLPKSKVYRDGHDGTPHYSLYARQNVAEPFRTPGPGAYRPEHAGPTAKKGQPAYSFGTRPTNRKADSVPAANAYTLPGMIGCTVQSGKPQAPCYSLRSRTGAGKDDGKVPGPGAYNITDPNLYKDKAPQFSMTSRNMMPSDATQKPGPGAYRPENALCFTKRCGPCPTFGIKHTPYMSTLVLDPKPSCECDPCY